MIVGDHDNRATIANERIEHGKDHLATLGIEISRWLVGQDQPRIVGQCPCECDTLLLSGTQLARFVIESIAEPDLFEQ